MGITKADALEQMDSPGSISNQEALVKKIQGTQITKPVKRVIPGGKTLTTDLTEANLKHAVYTWLRHCRNWTEGTISLCSDLSARKNKKEKVLDFNSDSKNAEWEVKGKRWLAERISEVLTRDNILAVQIQKEGLYLVTDTEQTFSPESDDWEPYVELTPFKPQAF
jgi:hypothetical protein